MSDGIHIMAYKEHRSSLAFAHVLHFTNGFLLKFCIADCKDFIYYKDFGVQMSRNSESEADHHTAAVAFYRGVDVAFAAAEINYLI